MNEQEREELQQRLAQLQRMRLTALTEFLMYDDQIKALLGGVPSMYEALLGLDEKRAITFVSSERPTIPLGSALSAFDVTPTEEFDWLDFASDKALAISMGLPHPVVPILDANILADNGTVTTLTMVSLGQNNIKSSHVTSVGCEIRVIRARADSQTDELKAQARIYTRFKGGGLYRYWPTQVGYWLILTSIMGKMAQGQKDTMTVGEFIERILKAEHESGQISCERLDGDKWVPALKPSEVIAERAASKGKRKGQEVAVEVIRDIVRESRNPDEKPHPEAPDESAPVEQVAPEDEGQQGHAAGSIPPTDVGDEAQF